MTKTNKEITVSKDFKEALAIEWQSYVDSGAATVDALEQELAFVKGFCQGVKWQEQNDTELLREAGIVIVPEEHFERMKRSLIQLASQIKNLWKPADGDDLPEIDREVIALLNNGKVVYSHRPRQFTIVTHLTTRKQEKIEAMLYGKGGWNQPNVKWWLDLELPKMEEKL